MDQQTQPQAPVEPAAPLAQAPQPAPAQSAAPRKKSQVWLWILGGCLTIIIIIGLVIGGLAWWGARKVKKAIQENQPKWEEMQKNAEDMQKNANDWQEQMKKTQEEMQNNLPSNSVPQ
jgi:uncharacterized protein HemX